MWKVKSSDVLQYGDSGKVLLTFWIIYNGEEKSFISMGELDARWLAGCLNSQMDNTEEHD